MPDDARPAAAPMATEENLRRPPRGEVESLWNACVPVTDDEEVVAWLTARALEPAAVAARDLARVVPRQARLPDWARFMGRPWTESSHRLLVPLFGAGGQMESVHARGLTARDPKGRNKAAFPARAEVRGLVMADALGRAVLRGSGERSGDAAVEIVRENGLVVVEGVPDFLTRATHASDADARAPAVLGVVSGSWRPELAARIPAAARVVVRTHHDAPGEKYATAIIDTIRERVRVYRAKPVRDDEGHLRDENDMLRTNSLQPDPFRDATLISEPALPETASEPPALAWKSIGDLSDPEDDWLRHEPPPRNYLLVHNDGTRAGFLPLGKLGFLAAAGGTGKTMLAVQIALAVATGLPLFDAYAVETPGRVLLILAEEDLGEARRRIFYATRTLALDDETARLVRERVVLAALAGEDVALTRAAEPGETGLPTTDVARRYESKLAEPGEPWRLVIFDPLSRFAGPDVETDNAAATRFVQVLERLTRGPGTPTVLVAHHTHKGARKEGVVDDTAARGASALGDGGRWTAVLESLQPGFVRLHVVKTNYTAVPEPLILARGPQGTLRRPTATELASLDVKRPKVTPAASGAASSRQVQQVPAGVFRRQPPQRPTGDEQESLDVD